MSVFPAVRPAVTPAVRGAFEQSYGGGAVALIKSLFAAGQQGFWLPFTDFASLSQDSAGILPYTALEQPVGRVLDRSGRGNHASQATSTARGVVSARVNILSNTTNMLASPWIVSANVTAVAAEDSFGGMTALKITPSVAQTTGASFVMHPTLVAPPASTIPRRISWFVKTDGIRYVAVSSVSSWAANPHICAVFDLQTQTAVAGTFFTSAEVTDMGGGVYRVSCVCTNSSSGYYHVTIGAASGLSASNVSTFVGDGIANMTVWGAQQEYTNNLTPTKYQRVTTPTDYDAVGFPKYLRLDGTDDFYTCGGGGSTTGFYYSDVVQLNGFGGVYTLYREASGDQVKGYSITIREDGRVACHIGKSAPWAVVYSTTVFSPWQKYHIAVVDDKTNVYMIINGIVEGAILSPLVISGGDSVAIGRINPPTGGGYLNGQITEPIYRAGPPPSAYERGVIRAYQMQKAGMA